MCSVDDKKPTGLVSFYLLNHFAHQRLEAVFEFLFREVIERSPQRRCIIDLLTRVVAEDILQRMIPSEPCFEGDETIALELAEKTRRDSVGGCRVNGIDNIDEGLKYCLSEKELVFRGGWLVKFDAAICSAMFELLFSATGPSVDVH